MNNVINSNSPNLALNFEFQFSNNIIIVFNNSTFKLRFRLLFNSTGCMGILFIRLHNLFGNYLHIKRHYCIISS